MQNISNEYSVASEGLSNNNFQKTKKNLGHILKNDQRYREISKY